MIITAFKDENPLIVGLFALFQIKKCETFCNAALLFLRFERKRERWWAGEEEKHMHCFLAIHHQTQSFWSQHCLLFFFFLPFFPFINSLTLAYLTICQRIKLGYWNKLHHCFWSLHFCSSRLLPLNNIGFNSYFFYLSFSFFKRHLHP